MGKDPKLPVIRPGTEAWDSWREYFERHLGWMPIVMRKIIDDTPDKPTEGVTVPTDFPQSFDASFREHDGWKPPMPKQLSLRLSHETIQELRERYGPNWGLKLMQHQSVARQVAKPYSNEELRALYRKSNP
jgi:hypothetical protein